MTHRVHLSRAVGWLLVALLATVVLVNLIGFFSPFWGHWLHPGDAAQSRALLDAVAPWTAVLSLLFLLPAWHGLRPIPRRPRRRSRIRPDRGRAASRSPRRI